MWQLKKTIFRAKATPLHSFFINRYRKKAKNIDKPSETMYNPNVEKINTEWYRSGHNGAHSKCV